MSLIKTILATFIFFLLFSILQLDPALGAFVEGRVLQPSKSPFPGALVTLYDPNDLIAGHSFSDNAGYFKINSEPGLKRIVASSGSLSNSQKVMMELHKTAYLDIVIKDPRTFLSRLAEEANKNTFYVGTFLGGFFGALVSYFASVIATRRERRNLRATIIGRLQRKLSAFFFASKEAAIGDEHNEDKIIAFKNNFSQASLLADVVINKFDVVLAKVDHKSLAGLIDLCDSLASILNFLNKADTLRIHSFFIGYFKGPARSRSRDSNLIDHMKAIERLSNNLTASNTSIF